MRIVSIVVPAYNESAGIKHFYESLVPALPKHYSYELLFVNDGSSDRTLEILSTISANDKNVRVIALSRNFGKEAATTAGITEAQGEAIVILDADGQHPVNIIEEFLAKWEKGAQVVIGIRTENQKEGIVKRYGSKLFYKIFNVLADEPLIPGATDFRLIDRVVQKEFIKLHEHSRITRALIDWLGFKKEYIYFTANPREHGEASYSTSKLLKLAVNSFVSLTTFPLYASAYLGMGIVLLTLLTGLFFIIEQYLLGDPLGLHISGSASLGMLILFVVGIMLACQGLVAMYISRIYEEAKGRPVYIINSSLSTPKRKLRDVS